MPPGQEGGMVSLKEVVNIALIVGITVSVAVNIIQTGRHPPRHKAGVLLRHIYFW